MKYQHSIYCLAKTALVSFMFFVISSCNNSTHLTVAKEKVAKYYEWLKRDQIDSIFTLFRKNSFLEADSIEFVQELYKIKELGDIVSCDYYGNTQETKFMNGNKTIFTTVRYKVKHANGVLLNEEFMFITDNVNSYNIYNIDITEFEE